MQLNLLVSCFITSLVYKRKLKMELRVPHMLHLFNVFNENKDSDNCAKMLEEIRSQFLAATMDLAVSLSTYNTLPMEVVPRPR